METLRLRRIQEPSRVESLLETYVSRAGNLPKGAYQIRDRSGLPSRVQMIVSQAIAQSYAWTAWSRGDQVWLFTGDMSLPLSREHGNPVLIIRLHNEEGELTDSGTWRYAGGNWSRCAD